MGTGPGGEDGIGRIGIGLGWDGGGRDGWHRGRCAPVRIPVPRSEAIRTPDGGQLILDWADDGSTAECPTVLLLPGLTGNSQAAYMLQLVREACGAGYR